MITYPASIIHDEQQNSLVIHNEISKALVNRKICYKWRIKNNSCVSSLYKNVNGTIAW